MKQSPLVLLVLPLLVLPAISPALMCQVLLPSASAQRVLVEGSSQTTTRPKWEHGFLARFDFPTATVVIVDRGGRVVLRSRLWPDQANQVRIRDVAVSPRGSFAATFSALSVDGAPGAFIGFFDASGKPAKLVRTTPAAALRICFLDDGTLWALVRMHDDQFNELPEYDMLRHYSADGVLIGTALPRQTVAAKEFPGEQGSLVASHDRVGLYLNGSKTWVDLSYSGQVLGRWQMPDHNEQYSQVLLSPTNEVFVDSQERRSKTAKSIFQCYRFDRGSGSLIPLDRSAISNSGPLFLLGFDGDLLVTSLSMGVPTLVWANAQ